MVVVLVVVQHSYSMYSMAYSRLAVQFLFMMFQYWCLQYVYWQQSRLNIIFNVHFLHFIYLVPLVIAIIPAFI